MLDEEDVPSDVLDIVDMIERVIYGEILDEEYLELDFNDSYEN